MAAFTHDGTENRMRWDRNARGFMEVWYVTLNHSESGAGLWFRYTLTSPELTQSDPYCELWGFYFDPEGDKIFGAKHRYSIDRLGHPNGRDDGAIVRIGDAWLSENHLEGEVGSNGRTLAWSLDFEPAKGCFQHLPDSIRSRVERRISTVCSPNLSVPFSGSVKIDDQILHFDGDRGCQSHRWGRRHSTTWTWAHCSTFEGGHEAVFEGVAARTKLGPIPAPTMSFLYLSHDGDELIFNELRWALRARSQYEMPTWVFTAHNSHWRIVGVARTRVGRMIQVEYADPDGTPRFCANSEVADLAIEIHKKADRGWQHHGSLTALGTAHVEFGRPERFEELPVSV